MLSQLFKDPLLINAIEKNARIKTIGRDEVLMQSGDEIVFVPLVLEGILRIVREHNDGQEFFLYHLYAGQICAMAVNCCQSGKQSMVKAIAEEESKVLLIPVNNIDDYFKYNEWKVFINTTYSTRFAELINVIDLVAFSQMDKQLLHYLQQRAQAHNTNTLSITHQQIADELRTHREAISRLLRTMEQKGIVRLGRNTIELLTQKLY